MSPPQTYTVIRQTWLSRKPSEDAQNLVFIAFAMLALGTAIYWRNLFGWAVYVPASAAQVFQQHEYWRLWTTLFAHSDFGHFAANSFLFVVLGYFLGGYFGAWLFPVAAFAFGGITNAFSLATYPDDLKLIGASGVVSWMGGVWLSLYMGINRKISFGKRFLRAGAVFLVIFAPSETFDPHISYRTHMIGFALGIVWGALYFYFRRAEFRRAEVTETIVEEDFNTPPLDAIDSP